MVQEQIQKGKNFGEWATRPEPDSLLVRRSPEVGVLCTLDAIVWVRCRAELKLTVVGKHWERELAW